jgi:hypothetical protein
MAWYLLRTYVLGFGRPDTRSELQASGGDPADLASRGQRRAEAEAASAQALSA